MMIKYFILFISVSVRSVPETKIISSEVLNNCTSIAVPIIILYSPHFQFVYIISTHCPDFR
jgi:hypothetical protein